jgi:hypothetical protein
MCLLSRHQKRRFVKGRVAEETNKAYWVMQADARKKKLMMFRDSKRKARQGQIKLFREYRVGEVCCLVLKFVT